jgi:hypothetical protein
MSDDFDSLGDYDPQVRDLFGLRTFRLLNGKLDSVVVSGNWEDGVCEAVCMVDKDHVAPAPDCKCGVYATHTLAALMAQYSEHARRIVAVIQAMGRTVNGPTGFKSAKAEVVAYWLGEQRFYDESISEADTCAEQWLGVRRWRDLDLMMKKYGLK